MKPVYEKNLKRVLYGIPIFFATIMMTFLSVAIGFGMNDWRYFFGMACAGGILVFLLFAYLWVSYTLGEWIFRKAVQWAGGSLSDQQSRDLYFYIEGFGMLIGLLIGVLGIIASSMSGMPSQGIAGAANVNFLGVGRSILSPKVVIPSLFAMYVEYKIFEKTTDTNGLAVIVFEWIISWALRVAFGIIVSMVLGWVYFFFVQNVVSTFDNPYMQNVVP